MKVSQLGLKPLESAEEEQEENKEEEDTSGQGYRFAKLKTKAEENANY